MTVAERVSDADIARRDHQDDGGAMVTAFPELWGRRLCLDFVNSWMTDHRGSGETYDFLAKEGWRKAFLALWDLRLDDPVEAVPVAALIDLRRLARATLEGWAKGSSPNPADANVLSTILSLAPMTREVRVGSSGYAVDVHPFARSWTWVLAEIIVSLVQLMNEGDPGRLKVCANADCSWMYYDDSQSMSRRWCTPRVCGNLTKVRRFRARRKQGARPADGLRSGSSPGN